MCGVERLLEVEPLRERYEDVRSRGVDGEERGVLMGGGGEHVK